MERDYKKLALKLDRLDDYLTNYLEENKNIRIRSDEKTPNQRTIKFGYVGVVDATVILFFIKNGCTTIQYKTGKNHELGKSLADYLYETVDPSESLTVNLSLKGFSIEDINVLISDLEDSQDQDDNSDFSISKHPKGAHSTKYEVVSNKYKDRIVVTHHETSNILQVQGRPLFCYRNIIYSLSILLDQGALLSVVIKTSDEDRILLKEEVACLYIEKLYEISFPRMLDVYKNLLISSYCVKLATPTLPEYSMLLYADLRVLEGVIKEVLMHHGKYTDSDKLDIGSYFNCTQTSSSMKNAHLSDFECSDTVVALELCYQFYREQRHSLFHMSDMAFSSRIISTLGEALNLSNDIASKIETLYQACNKI